MKTLYREDNHLFILDQTRLPGEVTYYECETYQDVIFTIKTLMVRGAPAIGVAAAFGMAPWLNSLVKTWKSCREIKEARPTAVNLFWAVDRILEAKSAGKSALMRRSLCLMKTSD